MIDNISPARRSEVMARIRQRDTGPEIAVRNLLRSLGYKFQVHRKDLPGVPDIVFPKYRKVVFVHGCFWHRHDAATCKLARTPKSRIDFWTAKFLYNRKRDRKQRAALRKLGWKTRIVWECELKEPAKVKRKLLSFLESR